MKAYTPSLFATFGKKINYSCLLFLAAVLFFFIGVGAWPAWGAVGCDLNDPDRDVARLFPESTGYKTVYTSILKKGGDKLLVTVERRLGDKFRGLYETIDVPYTIYEIFKQKTLIGLHPWREPEGAIRGHPGLCRPESRWCDPGLLHPENDKPICGQTSGWKIREAICGAVSQGFRPLRCRFRKGIR